MAHSIHKFTENIRTKVRQKSQNIQEFTKKYAQKDMKNIYKMDGTAPVNQP